MPEARSAIICSQTLPGHGLVNAVNEEIILPHDTEDEAFDKILALAGEFLDELFESRHYLKPVADFRLLLN